MAKFVFNYPYMEQEYLLVKHSISVGRLPANDLVIPNYALFKRLSLDSQKIVVNDLAKVSRIHAKISKDAEQWYVEDIGTKGMGSNYGTFINDVRIEVRKPYLLQKGDNIRFGSVECIFIEENDIETSSQENL